MQVILLGKHDIVTFFSLFGMHCSLSLTTAAFVILSNLYFAFFLKDIDLFLRYFLVIRLLLVEQIITSYF